MPEHFERGKNGWFDASRNCWCATPQQVTPISTAGHAPPPRPDLGTPNDGPRRPLAERVGDQAAASWAPRRDLEELRRGLQSSDPDQRAAARRVARSTVLVDLGLYERALSAFVERGGDPGPDVLPPPAAS